MDITRLHKKTIITHFLVIVMMLLLPATGFAVPQQQTDIKKPTRERVKDTGKKANDQKTATDKNKKDNKADAAKKDEKVPAPAAKPAGNKKENTPDEKDKKDPNVAEKPAEGNKIDDKTAAVEEVAPKPKPAPVVDKNYNGIDVSKHQGIINWDVVKKDTKIQYVYIKATEGSDRVDEQYLTNLHNARKAGIRVGSYHYLTNRSSVTTQFQNFAMNAPRDQQDLIPVIDVEVCRQWDAQQLRDSLKVFANMLEDYYGCKPIIYTYESFFKKYLGKAFADYPIFIAKYSSELPNINGVKWILWQYSESGTVNGIKGSVDLSRFNKGHTIQEILYRPAKGKPKISVKDAVDRNKPKPTTATLMDQPAPAQNDKQKEDAKKKAAERVDKAKAEKEKAEKEKADKVKANKEKAKAEREKAEKEKAEKEKAKADRAKANKEKANKEKAEREKAEKAKADKAKADREKAEKARAEKAKAEQEAKDKRRAEAKKAREEKAKQNTSKGTSNKSTNIRGALTQSQHNDSIRTAKQSGRKINKSSADND